MTPDFDRAQDLATRLLLLQDFNSLKFDIRDFRFDRLIKIDSIQNYCKVVGKSIDNFTCSEISGCFVLRLQNLNIILYDDSQLNEQRKVWGIVHEVGHIYLEHQNDTKINEIEAHFFSAQIMMPEIALIYLARTSKGLNTNDIVNYFNVSFYAATKRIKTLNKKGCWNYREEDKKLLDKLIPLLNQISNKPKASFQPPRFYSQFG